MTLLAIAAGCDSVCSSAVSARIACNLEYTRLDARHTDTGCTGAFLLVMAYIYRLTATLLLLLISTKIHSFSLVPQDDTDFLEEVETLKRTIANRLQAQGTVTQHLNMTMEARRKLVQLYRQKLQELADKRQTEDRDSPPTRRDCFTTPVNVTPFGTLALLFSFALQTYLSVVALHFLPSSTHPLLFWPSLFLPFSLSRSFH